MTPKKRERLIVVVTGGRDYTNSSHVFQVLRDLSPSLVIQGGAKGADRLAVVYAEKHQRDVYTCAARWAEDGNRAAGPKRNRRMLALAQRMSEIFEMPLKVVAFPGGPGTASCVARAKELGLEVIEVEDRGIVPTERRGA